LRDEGPRDRVTTTPPENSPQDDAPADDGPTPRKSGRGKPGPRRAARILAIVLAVVLIALIAIYLNRRAAARALLTGWLDERGAPSEVEIERLELNGVTARIRIGDPNDPDVVVERVEVDYALAMPWSKGGFGVRPSRIRLLRPVVRARWTEGRLSLGSLDPLMAEFTDQPPRPDTRGPVILVEDGRVRLTGEGVDVTARGDARLNDGKLMRLRLEVPPNRLNLRGPNGQRWSGEGLTGRLTLTTTGDRMAVRLDAAADAFEAGSTGTTSGGRELNLTARADLPYPDLKTRRGDGRAVVNAELRGERLNAGDAALDDASLVFDFDGAVKGWIETFSLEGLGRADLTAARASATDLEGRGVKLSLSPSQTRLARDDEGLNWRVNGPARLDLAQGRAGELTLERASLMASTLEAGGRNAAFEATGPLSLSAAAGRFGDLALRGVEGRGDLDLTSDGALLLRASTSLRSSGGSWTLLGPVGGDDPDDLKRMKAALGDFAVDIPRLRLLTGSAGTEVTLDRPAVITPRNGGALTINPATTPLYAARPGETGGGALDLAARRGAGLPEARIAVPEWRLTGDGFEARLEGEAALDYDLARGLKVRTKGLLRSASGVVSLIGDGCTDFTVERLELDENDVEGASGRLCPTDRPLVELREGGWRADGRLTDLAGSVPFLQARFEGAAGPLAVRGAPDRMDLQLGVSAARLLDTAEPTRFHPLDAEGVARLSGETWTGAFTLASAGRQVATVDLRHDGGAERGGITFDTGELTFDPQGLQPDDLTPLTDGFVESPVSGAVRFAGRFDWDPSLPEGGASSGRLTIPSLDFTSPAGPVKGLSGTVDFTSLAPLTTAEGQTLRVASLETVTPLTDLGLTFTLGQAALRVEGGQIQAAGGALRLEPLSVPLDGKQAFDGVIALDKVQLGELIVSAGFEDRVSLDAVVSGRLPFHWDPVAGVTIQGGVLTADQPGRLSIQREALSGLSAGGGGAEIPPGTVEDLAYQAMENLAFSDLDAQVNSLDGGRVSVLFHIRGRHDPPQRQELRLSLTELISRKFLERKLPLPSDTGIDLTLDTSLNLSQLIADLLAAQRGGGTDAAP
jgi:hypothetical protein